MEYSRDNVFEALSEIEGCVGGDILMEEGIKVVKQGEADIVLLRLDECAFATINYYCRKKCLQFNCSPVPVGSPELDVFLKVCEIIQYLLKRE